MRRICISLFALLWVISAAGQENNSWEFALNGSSDVMSNGLSIATDASGNSYVCGAFEGTLNLGPFSISSAGHYDIFVAKFSITGQPIWLIREGGTAEDLAYKLCLGPEGNVYVAGYFSTAITVGDSSYTTIGPPDILVLKYNNEGDLLWSRSWGTDYHDKAGAIATDDAGNVYVSGTFSNGGGAATILFDAFSLNSVGQGDLFLLKLDTAGQVQWAKRGGGGNGTEFGWDIALDPGYNVYVIGLNGSTVSNFGNLPLSGGQHVFIVKYDSSGNGLWVRGIKGLVDGAIYGHSIDVDAGGNAYVAAYSYDEQNVSFGSVTVPEVTAFTARYGSSGNLLWARELSQANTMSGVYDVAVDAEKNVYVAGFYGFWGVFGNDTIWTNGSWDATVTKLDSNGNFVWGAHGGGGTFDAAYGIALAPDGGIVSTGYIIGPQVGFGPYSLAPGNRNVFLAKLSQTTGLPITAGENAALQAYPNPCYEELWLSGTEGGSHYRITDITGRQIADGEVQNGRIDVQQLPPGLYILTLPEGRVKFVKR